MKIHKKNILKLLILCVTLNVFWGTVPHVPRFISFATLDFLKDSVERGIIPRSSEILFYRTFETRYIGESYAEELTVPQIVRIDGVSVEISQFNATPGPLVPALRHPFRLWVSGINSGNLLVPSAFSKKNFPLLAFVKITAENSFRFLPDDLILSKSLHHSVSLYLALKNFRI